jgi:hypothetical protein
MINSISSNNCSIGRDLSQLGIMQVKSNHIGHHIVTIRTNSPSYKKLTTVSYGTQIV